MAHSAIDSPQLFLQTDVSCFFISCLLFHPLSQLLYLAGAVLYRMDFIPNHLWSINFDQHRLHHNAIVVLSAVFGVFAGRLLQLELFLHFLRARLRSSSNPRLCRSPLPAVPVPRTPRCSKWKTFPGAIGAFHRAAPNLSCSYGSPIMSSAFIIASSSSN